MYIHIYYLFRTTIFNFLDLTKYNVVRSKLIAEKIFLLLDSTIVHGVEGHVVAA